MGASYPSHYVCIEPESPRWAAAWAQLAVETNGDLAQECQCCGEVWQYMGSWRGATGAVIHEFRHRHSPVTGEREYRRFTEETSRA